ncbi:Ribosomal protein S18 acetylase RimI [Pedobacter steynii]|uniref:Ribosomal protein S18 acetylase RimI n=1 Tax=Pedobacter steynii TaxID=430522 RepID=A0A1G9V5A9_9SPHI|nr:GNAT family N-acetyltransferase [Pedobacter steynii]NQX40983.1 GNAT family N-acetyltransferase [Pedobacter steynii]SDM67348.1 Ribosomal protein S18 acetylase RimI [Pedobacter steynii]
MENIKISKASIEAVETLQEIGRATFFETFATSNTGADMKKYLDEHFSREQLITELNHPDSRFYIAWEDQSPIGYLKVNTAQAQTELQDENSLEIERIYVLSAYHGKKVGQQLYEKALEVAGLLKKSSVWLGVWEENPRAIKFYTKNGFVPFGQHIFKMGDDEQTDIMMRREL